MRGRERERGREGRRKRERRRGRDKEREGGYYNRWLEFVEYSAITASTQH